MTDEKTPDILILMMDSARFGKLSCYGYPRKTTPNIDKIAKEGTLFLSAYTQGPWTLPSHTSLFTGLYPFEHGRCIGSGDKNLEIENDMLTLPELLSKKGYVTAGFSSNPWVGKLTDLDRRFDDYVEDTLKVLKGYLKIKGFIPKLVGKNKFLFKFIAKIAANNIFFNRFYVNHNKMSKIFSDSLCDWMKRNEGNKRFAFVNFMNCHYPYYPPRSFLKKFRKGGLNLREMNEKYKKSASGKLSPELSEDINDSYDANLRYLDYQIGKIYDFLKEEGRLDDTILIITSDHGVNLGEYDSNEYKMQYITDTNTHIPLIVRYPPFFKPKKMSKNVQLMDIFYTISQIVGFDNPNTPEKRESLQDKINNGKEYVSYCEVYLPYTGPSEDRDLVRSVTKGKFKLISSEKEGKILVDKERDPQEKKDFSNENKEVYEELNAALIGILSSDTKKGDEEDKKMEDEAKRRLANLGYF